MELLIAFWFLLCLAAGVYWLSWKAVAWLAGWRPSVPTPAAPPAPRQLTREQRADAAESEYRQDLSICDRVADPATKGRMKAAAAEKLRRKLAEIMR